MYIWFRMIRMFFIAWLEQRRHGRVGLFETTVFTTRAWPNDLDFNVHVNNGRINTLVDLGRMHFFLRTGLLQYALRQGVRPMVGDITSKFRREIKAFDEVVIHTRLIGWVDKWAFMEHRMVRENRVIANVVMRGMFKGRSGAMSPEVLLSEFAPDTESHVNDLPQWALDWHRGMEGMSAQLRAEEASL